VTLHTGDDGGASIVIADHGLGMSAERLAEENARLIRRERLDLVPTKVLGLFVVGTLARRWSVGITLTRTPGGGVTAEVAIPASLLLSMSRVAPAPATPAVQAASGPRPSTAAAPGDAAPLPRRVPKRAAAATAGTEDDKPAIPKPRDEDAADDPQASRPLRRRVRGATLRTTVGDTTAETARPAAPPADADAVRSALEEFEAAVEQANRDSASGPDPKTSQDQNHLPEGAEQ
jgi:hypothetical protein